MGIIKMYIQVDRRSVRTSFPEIAGAAHQGGICEHRIFPSSSIPVSRPCRSFRAGRYDCLHDLPRRLCPVSWLPAFINGSHRRHRVSIYEHVPLLLPLPKACLPQLLGRGERRLWRVRGGNTAIISRRATFTRGRCVATSFCYPAKGTGNADTAGHAAICVCAARPFSQTEQRTHSCCSHDSGP